MSFWYKGRLAIAETIHLDLTHSQQRYAEVLQAYAKPHADWLEIGCGRQILPDWALSLEEQRRIVEAVSRLIGVDADAAIKDHPLLTHRVMGLGGYLPFREASFDLVTANMVVEHIPDPASFLTDVRRVLRPNGKFLFHTPNYLYYLIRLASAIPDAIKKPIIYRLEERAEEDVFPTHYRMNTAAEVNTLAAAHGFRVEKLQICGSCGSFAELGPFGWLECIPLKFVSMIRGGAYDSNLIAVLSKS